MDLPRLQLRLERLTKRSLDFFVKASSDKHTAQGAATLWECRTLLGELEQTHKVRSYMLTMYNIYSQYCQTGSLVMNAKYREFVSNIESLLDDLENELNQSQ